MLELRPSCECCDVDLPPDSPLARICTYECTFCASCVERILQGRCPNCGGEFVPRPRRPPSKLVSHPASTRRVFNPALREKLAQAASSSRPSRALPAGLVVRQARSHELALVPTLVDLLIDAVHSGASVGFLAPLPQSTAESYWQRVFASIGDQHWLWVAEQDGQVVGSVQLALCDKDNGRHRGEVQKLFVHRSVRGQGLSTALMKCLEAEARRQHRSLLVLDTLLASEAEHVYRHLGWTRAGEIPDYATAPDGELFPTVYYFKTLAAA